MILLTLFIMLSFNDQAQAQSNIKVEQTGDETTIISAEPPAAATSTASTALSTISTWSVAVMATYFVASLDQDEKITVLEHLRATPPKTADDIHSLVNLYARFPEARAQAEESLQRLSPQAQGFGPYFVSLIEDDDPFLRMFGLSGAYRLRFQPALSPIHKLAEAKFLHPRPSLELLPGELNTWQSQFSALRILALWEGKSALPLIMKKTRESPQTAVLVAMYYWAESFDKLVAWSQSSRADEVEMAQAAWGAQIPVEALRKTWPKLKAVALDSGKKPETRHRAALKLGLASGDEEVTDLLKERDARKKDERTRTLLDAALFASRSPRALPILEEYARTAPSPLGRAGALLQLREMLDKKRYAELLRWAAANDPDMENRANAKLELDGLDRKD
jgi:hypothetical protein